VRIGRGVEREGGGAQVRQDESPCCARGAYPRKASRRARAIKAGGVGARANKRRLPPPELIRKPGAAPVGGR
jgi:hypothetical protein